MSVAFVIAVAAALVLVGGAAMAESLSIKAIMSPREQIRVELQIVALRGALGGSRLSR